MDPSWYIRTSDGYSGYRLSGSRQDAFNGGFNTVDFRGLSVDSFLYADRFAIYFVSSCRIYNEVIKIVLEICGFDAQLLLKNSHSVPISQDVFEVGSRSGFPAA